VRRLIEALSPAAEFAIVVLGAFGYFIVVSLVTVVSHGRRVTISNHHLGALLVYELILLLVLGGFLRIRGWTIARFDIRPSARETLKGFGLAGLAYVIYVLALIAIAALWPQAIRALRASGVSSPGISLVAVIAVSILNPVFEEVFVCGYIITALRKASDPWTGVHVSVAIRLLYHLYQGAIGVLGIVPFGLVAGVWFARTGRLWPVIVAHAVIDFVGLLVYVR
jgi:uncharacterized protein